MNEVSLSTTIPGEYADELDRWIARNLGEGVSRADGLRLLLPKALGLPPIQKTYRRRPTSLEQDERADRLLEKKHALGTWSAVAADEGLSVGRVKELVARYENRMKRAEMVAQANHPGMG